MSTDGNIEEVGVKLQCVDSHGVMCGRSMLRPNNEPVHMVNIHAQRAQHAAPLHRGPVYRTKTNAWFSNAGRSEKRP